MSKLIADRSREPRSRWSLTEDQVIKDHYKNMTYAEMVSLLPNRKIKAIVNRAYRLGIGYRTDLWKSEEEESLRQAYIKNEGKKNGWLIGLARKMGRSPANLVRKAIHLGLQTDRKRKGEIRSLRGITREERKLWTPEQWQEQWRELRLKHGRFMKEYHATNEHPKGMLGKHHSEETRKKNVPFSYRKGCPSTFGRMAEKKINSNERKTKKSPT